MARLPRSCYPHSRGRTRHREFELDLDYIVEWKRDKKKFSFLLVPATLRFHEVFGLRVALDWATPSAGLSPFSLSGIERRTEDRQQYTATLWRVAVNWPAGEIEFEAKGFTQMTWGKEVVSSRQVLSPSERVKA